ncbi:MAG: protoporphyrinogen oxidase [Desulfovibrio sp.]|nr:protoporphyrinogen oxidase [Desulfovibrio sp.]
MIRPLVCLLLLGLFLLPPNKTMADTDAPTVRDFQEFSLTLPPKWDGNEQVGFRSKDSKEYMLTLGIKDAAEESYRALISLYLLPNTLNKDSPAIAKALAKNQADATEPALTGRFWSFTGDPRDRFVKGRGTTSVLADKDTVLIIIVKDPENLGAASILDSLEPKSTRTKALWSQNHPSNK